MKLSEQLKHDHECGDFGKALAGYAELAAATELDAERYRWLKTRLLGADFDWNESGTCALVFEWPKDSPVSANCDRTIDDAMLKTPNATSHRGAACGASGGLPGYAGD